MAEIQRNAQTQMQTAEVSPPYAEQRNTSVGASETTITLLAPSRTLLIHNTHATQTITIKFKEKSTQAYNAAGFVIAAGAQFSLNIRVTEFKLQGSGAGTTYQMVATQE